MDFKSLKNNRKAIQQQLINKLQKMQQSAYPQDERFWYPERGKDGQASAVIRFLPSPDASKPDEAWVRLWTHRFEGPGGWYIENSLTTLGQDDPVAKYNSYLWNEVGTKAAKKQASAQKRKLEYISNIYVIKDPQNPDNEGKVFLYRYGKQVMDKIVEKMMPDPISGLEPIIPFDYWDGANFLLRITMTSEGENKYPSYIKSEFLAPSQLAPDKELEAIHGKLHSLAQFVAADQFKSYEELEARLNKVLKLSGETSQRIAPKRDESDDEGIDDSIPYVTDDDADADLSKFQKLINGME